MKKYLRARQVAERYGCHVRTIERMVKDRRIPAPIYLGSRFPLWSIEELDSADRQATRERVRPAIPQPAATA
jgi:excisionase family DNA binding protein